MATQTATRQRFSGFPPGGFEFFMELQARQSREWFKANKNRYEEIWVRPLEALLHDVAERLVDVFPEMPRSSVHIFRIQRDTRFAADKSPYKTHVAGHMPVRPGGEADWSVPNLYIHFGLDDSVAAIGQWGMDKEALELFRRAVDAERSGAPLQKVISQLEAGGFHVSSHETLKRVPPPYPQDHPRGNLLKLKGLAVSAADIPEELMGGPQLLDWLSEKLHQAAPVAHWIERYVKAGASGR